MLNSIVKKTFIQPIKLWSPGRYCLFISSQAANTAAFSSSSSSTSLVEEDFWIKNARLKRPISPFQIYKPQITWTLSITHRITGTFLAIGFYGFGFSQLFASTNFINQIAFIQSYVPASILMMFKSVLMTSFIFHLFAGIRHLMWDMGYGFKLTEVYNSGYSLLIVTLLSFLASTYYFA